MRYTQNINLPIVEDNDLYSKEINNLAFEKIDEEIQGLADIVETLDSPENSIADVKKDINDIKSDVVDINEQLVTNVEQISYINTNKSYWVSPEDFGCKGNGVIDDTVNLQKAITYCYENKKTLKCKDNSIYCISNTLQILDYIDIEMNNSIIKAIQPMDKMINYKFPQDYRNYINNTNLGKMSYSSLHLDGNNMAKYGIYIEDGVCITFYNTKIRFASIGIHIHSASELLFDNIYVRCNPTDNNSIGVENLANDCLFNMIYIMDAHVGILNNGLNHMSKVHVWKGSNFNGSIGIKFMGGNLFLDSSYIDSYANAFYIGSSSQLMINNCNTFYNGAMYTDNFDSPIIFFISDPTKDMMGYSSITNCFIKGKNSNTKLSNVENLRVREANNSFDNLDMSYVTKLNTKNITLSDGIIKNSDNATGCAFVSFENATRYIYLNIEKTSGFSHNDSIGKLPFSTTQSFVVPCLISANQYFNGVVEHAILVINKTGNIIVKTNSTLTPKYLAANFTLPSGSFR
jgi:hypothetical protein|nr:MAG TPA: rhamnogalacturonase A [Caudoviricetes sp.]